MSPELKGALARENWEKLSKEAFWYAQTLVKYRWWRGDLDGVLPDGHDAESIVNEAVAELFNGKCRLKGMDYTRDELRYELRRLVYNQVHRFNRRRETWLVKSEVDLTPVALREQGRSILERIPGTDEWPDQQAIRHEGRKLFRRFMAEFSAFLGEEQDLRNLFGCLCGAFEKREEIAKRLGVEVQVVTNARKRLDRRLDEFGAEHPEYPRVFIEEMKRV
jgi:hypothetical protein